MASVACLLDSFCCSAVGAFLSLGVFFSRGGGRWFCEDQGAAVVIDDVGPRREGLAIVVDGLGR